MNDRLINIMDECKKAQEWFSDTMSGMDYQNLNNEKKDTIHYSEVVRELLGQINNGCDIVPIDSSFSYEDLMEWIKTHARGNRAIVIKDNLEYTTGQVIAVVFAIDNMILLSKEMPKVCFVYQTLNHTIQDLFPGSIKVYVKPFKIM